MKPKVLIIEDNEQNLYLLTFIMEKFGYEVNATKEGKSGLKMANKIKPTLILLDIQLPEMDGYEVARKLRENPDLATTSIVVVSSYAMAGDREKAMECGCNGYIEKPINPKTFFTQIEQYLKQRR